MPLLPRPDLAKLSEPSTFAHRDVRGLPHASLASPKRSPRVRRQIRRRRPPIPQQGLVLIPHAALTTLFLDIHRYGIILAQIFWGLWLFPLALLIFKSQYLPRVIGILLVAACSAYAVSSLTYLLAPEHGEAVTNVALTVGGLGELALMLWLIIRGAKVPSLAPSRII